MKKLGYLMLFSLCAVTAFAQDGAATKKKTVAVLDFQSSGDLKASQVKILTTRFQTFLVNTQSFDVLERERMAEILKQQDFIMSDACNSAECAVQVGQLLGVEYMIAGDIGLLGETYTVDLRMIDVSTGKILQNVPVNHEGKIDGLLVKLETMAAKIAAGLNPAVSILDITSTPAGGEILVDGQKTNSVTPSKIENLKAGKHQIEIRKGFMIGKQEVNVIPGKNEKITMTLTVPNVAVSFTSEPSGADVTIDNNKVGTTPFQTTLKAGRYDMTISKIGYEKLTQVIEIKDWNKSISGTLKLKSVTTASTKKKKSNTMWYVLGGAAVAGGAAAAVLLGGKKGGGGSGTSEIGNPPFPNNP